LAPPDPPPPHIRRRRYPGKNPRSFHDKYKELNPAQYAADVEKVRASGRTPAGTHVPIMEREVLERLRPHAGETAVDCTLGWGGHAQAILERVQPGGRVIGIDVDPLELPRAEARLRAAGFGLDVFVARHANFAGLPKVLAAEGLERVDMILADLGVSSMQFDNPDRGFSYKGVGPLDMRMNPRNGQTAAHLIAQATEDELARLLDENADEPHAAIIARLLKEQPLDTTHAADRLLRAGLTAEFPRLTKAELKMSIRRTFQALRIAVNNEFAVLDALLRSLPYCLAPGGRVVMLTFHSGEDRRVKKAFQAGHRTGVYSEVATQVVRSAKEETFSNRRASAAKLRWAIRSDVDNY
jgi:16S rRNA (cytosine1402-N4)-methyltransferase